jgi:hypothetical protein
MKVPEEWGIRAAVVAVPWAHPERADRYSSLLDAVINAGSVERSVSSWIVLEDGRILSPAQISKLHQLVRAGRFAEVLEF